MSDLAALAQKVVADAGGSEDVEVFVTRSRTTEIRASDDTLEHVNAATTEGIAVRVVSNNRQGFAYTTSLDEDAVRATLAEARDNARFAGEDEHNTIGRPDDVEPAPLAIDIDALAAAPVDRKVDTALALSRAARRGHPAIRGVEAAAYADEVEHSVVATTTGILSEFESADCYVFVGVLAGDGDETQTGEWYAVGRSIDELDVDATAATAVARAVRMLGAAQPQSRRLTVVLDPMATAQFLSVIGSTLTGEAVLKGYSPFGDRVGETIAAARVTLTDDPTDPEAFSAAPFDAEGVATRRTPLIDNGVLTGFVHHTYSGRRSGQGSTGSAARAALSAPVSVACRALSLTPGTITREELIRQVGDGLLVQTVKGLHSGVNPISGDFSAGAEGLLIKEGAVAEPVREITIASTLQRMLQDVAAIANDVQALPTSARGMTVAVADVTMSGR